MLEAESLSAHALLLFPPPPARLFALCPVHHQRLPLRSLHPHTPHTRTWHLHAPRTPSTFAS